MTTTSATSSLSVTSLFNTTSGGSATNIMSVLTQTAQDAATALAQQRFTQVQTLLQNQYNQKVAALQAQSQPTGQENFLQVQISGLGQQKSTFSTLETHYANNSAILADLSGFLTNLQNAAQAGDSAAFDGALGSATADVSYLTAANPNPALQDDGVGQLKTNGLGIKSSSSYDLSTAAGQAAAIADINAAQSTLTQISVMTTLNQNICASQLTALSSQYDQLNTQLQNDQFAQQVQSTTQILTLKNQLNTQLHLVELQFSNTQAAAKSLENQQNNLQAVLSAPAPGTIFAIFA